ncbi:zeta-sarcoglycan isoform X2 [Chelonus insularis]|nr:zeta-sarcoglycan isoform X2 [Chelonus insularis]XP_034939817.1 zeta-sarcoglycan isoform X2 [Chelonus insularis]
MDSSPTLSIGGSSKARAALLATTGTGTGSTDRRVVFLASSPGASSHDTKTWPHNWSPNTTGNNYRSSETSPYSEYKLRMPRGQTNWSEEPEDTNSISRQSRPSRPVQSSPSRTCTPQQDEQNQPTCNGYKFGVNGWRKICLCMLILGLTIMVSLNFAITLWLLKVMEFSAEGMGSLKIVPGGVELKGQAAILDALIASSVRSRKGRNLVLESWNNFTASARARDGRLLARFTLSEDSVNCMSKAFHITDSQGGVLFSATREQVVVGATMLKVTGAGGAVFRGSVQTPIVRAEAGHSLELESATRSLEIKAPERVVIESRAGEIFASCLSDLTLQSIEGVIRLDAESVFLKDLKIGAFVQKHQSREQQQIPRNDRSSTDQRESNIYQLCVCANGKLFLARPDGICQADKTIC